MLVWVVEFIPYGRCQDYNRPRIEGLFSSYQKAKVRALELVDSEVKYNEFVVNELEYDNFKNHNKEYEDVHIEVYAEKDENYNEYFMMRIIPKVVE